MRAHHRVLFAAFLAIRLSDGSAALSPDDLLDVSAVQGTERELVLTGSSSSQDALPVLLSNVCSGGIVRMDRDANIRTYLCRNARSWTSYAFQNLLIHHNVTGGSLYSVLATNTDSASSERQLIISDFSYCHFDDAKQHYIGCGSGGGHTRTAQSMGGMSDVDPDAFAESGVYTPGAAYPVTVSAGAGAQVFGVVANTILYRHMQRQQGVTNELGPVLPSSCYDGNAFDAATGVYSLETPASDLAGDDFAPACQPNITKEAYASIANGTASALKNGWAALLGAGITGPGNNLVKLCRRVATSGTQAASNLYFLANPSSPKGKLAPAGHWYKYGGPNGLTVGSSKHWWWINSTTGDVFDCLGHANNGTGPDLIPPTGLGGAASAGRHFALGVVSVEKDWRTQEPILRKNFRFLKLDGVSPEEIGASRTARDPVGRVTNSDVRDQCARESYSEGRYLFGYEFVVVLRQGLQQAQNGFIRGIFGSVAMLDAAAVAPSANCNTIADNPPRGIIAKPTTAAGVNHAANPTRVSKGTSAGSPYKPITFPAQGAEN